MISVNSTRVPLIPPEDIPLEDKKENEFGRLTSKEFLYQSKSRDGKALQDPILDAPATGLKLW